MRYGNRLFLDPLKEVDRLDESYEDEFDPFWDAMIDGHSSRDLRRFDAFAEQDIDAADAYRRHNRRFRRDMLAQICGNPNHPLHFLVKRVAGKCVWRRGRDRQIDAGHITPVAVLRRRGWTTERLAVQDRQLNRSMQATPIKVRNVRGVPVEENTLRQWVRRGLLGGQWLRSRRSSGWKTFDDADHFFAMGNFRDWMIEPDDRNIHP